MDASEFSRLHHECESSLQQWIFEATRTCTMLGDILQGPPSLEQRSELQNQRSLENEAQCVHMDNRHRLFQFARSGYGDHDLIYGVLAE
jgi:hypothetical protein